MAAKPKSQMQKFRDAARALGHERERGNAVVKKLAKNEPLSPDQMQTFGEGVGQLEPKSKKP
jgi:hypothetical protein